MHPCQRMSLACVKYIFIYPILCRTPSYHIILYHIMYDIDHDHHCTRFYVHHCSCSLSYSLLSISCSSISSYTVHEAIFYSTIYIHVCMLVYGYDTWWMGGIHDSWCVFYVYVVLYDVLLYRFVVALL